jgi:hypothetical protein
LEYQGFVDLLDDHPNLYLGTAFPFYPGQPGSFNLSPAYLERHQDRIVSGSDFPNLIFPTRRNSTVCMHTGCPRSSITLSSRPMPVGSSRASQVAP